MLKESCQSVKQTERFQESLPGRTCAMRDEGGMLLKSERLANSESKAVKGVPGADYATVAYQESLLLSHRVLLNAEQVRKCEGAECVGVPDAAGASCDKETIGRVAERA